jgi:hypothetical protein
MQHPTRVSSSETNYRHRFPAEIISHAVWFLVWTARRHRVNAGSSRSTNMRLSVREFKLIAMDTSKCVFTLHGVDEQGEVMLRRELRRGQVETFFRKLPPTDVVLEACGGSHHWGRVLGGLGHRVRLIPPQYAKPFVKRGKTTTSTLRRSVRLHCDPA